MVKNIKRSDQILDYISEPRAHSARHRPT